MNTAHLRATLRAKQSAILAAIQRAMPNASAEPRPVRGQKEMADVFEHRIGAWADRCGEVTLADSGSRYTVTNSRESLAEFAAEITKSTGFRLTPKRAIPRESDRRASLKPADESAAKTRYGSTSTADLRECIAAIKADFVKTARQCWQGGQCNDALAAGERIEYMQRELVRRGELSATDLDRLNAEPTHEEIDAPSDTATVPLFASEPAETSAPCDQPAAEQPAPAQATDKYGRRALPAPVEVAGRLHKYRIKLGYYWTIAPNEFNRATHAQSSWTAQKYVTKREGDMVYSDWQEVPVDAVPATIARKAQRMAEEFNRATPAPAANAANAPVTASPEKLEKLPDAPEPEKLDEPQDGDLTDAELEEIGQAIDNAPFPHNGSADAVVDSIIRQTVNKRRLWFDWSTSRWRSAHDLPPSLSTFKTRTGQAQAVVRTPIRDAYKSPAARLAEVLGGRWSHRQGGYVMPQRKAERMLELWRADATACVFSRKITLTDGTDLVGRQRMSARLH